MMNTPASSKETREHDAVTDATGRPVATLPKSGLEPSGGARELVTKLVLPAHLPIMDLVKRPCRIVVPIAKTVPS